MAPVGSLKVSNDLLANYCRSLRIFDPVNLINFCCLTTLIVKVIAADGLRGSSIMMPAMGEWICYGIVSAP